MSTPISLKSYPNYSTTLQRNLWSDIYDLILTYTKSSSSYGLWFRHLLGIFIIVLLCLPSFSQIRSNKVLVQFCVKQLKTKGLDCISKESIEILRNITATYKEDIRGQIQVFTPKPLINIHLMNTTLSLRTRVFNYRHTKLRLHFQLSAQNYYCSIILESPSHETRKKTFTCLNLTCLPIYYTHVTVSFFLSFFFLFFFFYHNQNEIFDKFSLLK